MHLSLYGKITAQATAQGPTQQPPNTSAEACVTMTAQPSVVSIALITLPSTCIQPPPPSGNENENQVQSQTNSSSNGTEDSTATETGSL